VAECAWAGYKCLVVTYPRCGASRGDGDRFCADCGAPLGRCPSCGESVSQGHRFCPACGHALAGAGQGSPAAAVASSSIAPSAGPGREPAAERRLGSVLFADLVGFTTLSESRDPEEVRELLARYFDTSRSLIERYGGLVEKFIGDAVMAVRGTPAANEDDAERAVRAALDLVEAVSALGQEIGAPGLKARAGVLTGEAAVNLEAAGQGMVAGDLVNTASRIQSVADPGSVFVGEATRRSTEAAVAYEDAGLHQMKGKAEPAQLWRALRVVGELAARCGPKGWRPRSWGGTGNSAWSKRCSTRPPTMGRPTWSPSPGSRGSARAAWRAFP